MNNREAFEAWFNNSYLDHNLNRDEQGDYISTTPRLIWQAWQAALASQATQVATNEREAFEAAAKECGDEEKFAKNMQLSLACYAYFIHGVNAALASQAQQNGKCDECGKSQSDGFALYCVKCIDMISTKEKSKPESLLLGTTNQHKASSHLAIVPDCSTPLPPAPEGDKP